MVTARTLQTIDYAILGPLGVCVAVCLAAAAYAAPWTRAMREARAFQQFNRLWLARVFMESAAALWLLWALLPMMALWGVRSEPGRASNLTSENLCRIYLALSLGLLQPMFLLLALLLCQTGLSPRRKHTYQERTSLGVLGWAAVGTAPVAAVQVVLAWFSKIFQKHDWEQRTGSLPRYFFGVYDQGSAEDCATDSPGCIVCIYPAAMVIVTGIFSLAFLLALCIVSSRVAATTINRRLMRRMRTLELGMDALVVANIAVLGATVSSNPFSLVWQLLWIFYEATSMGMALLATWLLTAVPVYVAKSADKHVLGDLHDPEAADALADVEGGGAGGPPQEMALLDKVATGLLSDEVSSGSEGGSGSPRESFGGSSRGGGSKRSLLQPSSLKSSHKPSSSY